MNLEEMEKLLLTDAEGEAIMHALPASLGIRFADMLGLLVAVLREAKAKLAESNELRKKNKYTLLLQLEGLELVKTNADKLRELGFAHSVEVTSLQDLWRVVEQLSCPACGIPGAEIKIHSAQPPAASVLTLVIRKPFPPQEKGRFHNSHAMVSDGAEDVAQRG